MIAPEPAAPSKPRYGSLPCRLPAGQTVRIVARNVFPGDAVGNLCLDLQDAFEQNQFPVALYAEVKPEALKDRLRPTAAIADDFRDGDALLYFHSTYDPALPELLDLPWSRAVAYYHGVTDPRLLEASNPELAAVCAQARDQNDLLLRFDALAANSEASVAQLKATLGGRPRLLGKHPVHILPPKLLPLDAKVLKDTPKTARQNALLYVGRLKSHKKIEDLLAFFAAYRRLDPQACLWIVGGDADPAYMTQLNQMERDVLQLPPGAVQWRGFVDAQQLQEAYGQALAYVCMSEDEGFCLPVLEAMMADLPVFAYGIPAVREVLGGSGVCFDDKSDFDGLARLTHDLLHNQDHLADLRAAQAARARTLIGQMDGRAYLALFNVGPNLLRR